MKRLFRHYPPLLALVSLAVMSLACVRSQPEIIVITATFAPPLDATPGVPTQPVSIALSSVPDNPAYATPDPTRAILDLSMATEYAVQPGDTLSGIAAAHGISVETLLAVNEVLDPNTLAVGQIIRLPAPPDQHTSDFKLIPDSRLVRGPDSAGFDVADFISRQPGFIRIATDTVGDQILTAAQIVQQVSLEFSVDARLLLALLEYKGGWLSNPTPSDDAKAYALGGQPSELGFDRSGLYRQLAWTADQLNAGYYGWKYRGMAVLEFEDGIRLLYSPGLNAGTVALQYFFSLYTNYVAWQFHISPEGFYRTYYAYFGDPLAGALDPLVPAVIEQPPMTMPFPAGETWFFTGGPHGGWGTGSAWAAIDFAPPDDRPQGSTACYLSEFWATAAAPGVIARSDQGAVVLDLDGDGNETTGWTILYLHMATEGRVPAGTFVQVGSPMGHPSCEGGFSNATHMHFARRFNGEWIPAFCEQCPADIQRPPLVMSGWTVVGYRNQEYQGYMYKGGEQRLAEQGRLSPDNRVSW